MFSCNSILHFSSSLSYVYSLHRRLVTLLFPPSRVSLSASSIAGNSAATVSSSLRDVTYQRRLHEGWLVVSCDRAMTTKTAASCRNEITGNTGNLSRLLRHPTSSLLFLSFLLSRVRGMRGRIDERASGATSFGSIMPGYVCHLIAMHFRPR